MARKVQKLFKTADELLEGYFPELTKSEKEKFKNQPKDPIKLRVKKLSNSLSLYLDLYRDGKRQYEFLKLYLNEETGLGVKEKNRETLEIANTILYEKIADLNKKGAGFVPSKRKANLIQYILFQADEALKKSGNKHGYYYTLQSLAKHIACYSSDKVTIDHVDKNYILGFINYLKTAKNINYKRTEKAEKRKDFILGQNTQHNLFMKFKYVIKKAMIADIIAVNPLDKIESSDRPKERSGTREFLTIEEIKKLIATEFKNDDLKRAFLFCCLVGLRYGDVAALAWGDIEKDNKGDRFMRIRIKKTGREEIFPVSDEAMKMLPDKREAADSGPIFSLPKNDHANKYIKKWVEAAGIKKRITFHCSRHTAATLNLSLGTPIETVSKLMGHTKISTTQIYAKIVDENKKAAVNKQNGIFD